MNTTDVVTENKENSPIIKVVGGQQKKPSAVDSFYVIQSPSAFDSLSSEFEIETAESWKPADSLFDTHWLLLAVLSQRPHRGYQIEVKCEKETDSNIQLSVVEVITSDSCDVATALSFPFVIYSIPKTAKVLQHEWRVRTAACTGL